VPIDTVGTLQTEVTSLSPLYDLRTTLWLFLFIYPNLLRDLPRKKERIMVHIDTTTGQLLASDPMKGAQIVTALIPNCGRFMGDITITWPPFEYSENLYSSPEPPAIDPVFEVTPESVHVEGDDRDRRIPA
jgi:hypothetical protein